MNVRQETQEHNSSPTVGVKAPVPPHKPFPLCARLRALSKFCPLSLPFNERYNNVCAVGLELYIKPKRLKGRARCTNIKSFFNTFTAEYPSGRLRYTCLHVLAAAV